MIYLEANEKLVSAAIEFGSRPIGMTVFRCHSVSIRVQRFNSPQPHVRGTQLPKLRTALVLVLPRQPTAVSRFADLPQIGQYS